MQLRPYQSEAMRAVVQELDKKGKRSTLIVLPTGCGKTIVFCGIARYFAFSTKGGRDPCRVLVLAHQNLLLDQAAEKFKQVLGIEVNREKGKQTCRGSKLPISVATVQTMAKRLSYFEPDYFGLIIIDESHHIMAANYQMVLDHFKGAKILGVTATPDRSDGKKINKFFDSIASTYTIAQAQHDGYLAPLTIKRSAVHIDLEKAKLNKGDLINSQLGSIIEPHLHEIAKEARILAKGRKTVCFVPLIKTAKKAAEIFSHYGFRSEWTAGNDKEREQKLKRYEAGDYDIIFNSMLLTEGWDCPSTDCVIILRPTTSRPLYVQMLGRGLRLSPGKKDCLLIDFLFQHDDFDLATPEEILEPEDQGRGSGKRPGSGGEVADREETLAKKLRISQAKYLKLLTLKDPFKDPQLSKLLKDRYKTSELRDEPIDKKQQQKLERYGINWIELSYIQAKILIDFFANERPLTKNQAWRLKQLGYTPDEIVQMNFGQATKELKRQKMMGRW